VANLHTQIGGLTARLLTPRCTQVAGIPPAVTEQVLLVDLLLLRGQVLGRIVDYERAAGLAEMLVRDAPTDGAAWLARARTRATLHLFAEALGDLDAARHRGADHAEVDAQRAAILQAVGCSAEALVLRQDAARRRRGLMRLGERDLPAARSWFAAAVHRVPSYAPAVAHLAEVDAALGALDGAVERLHVLAMSSDDPEYGNMLAKTLDDAGRFREGERWHAYAASRYQELVARHPQAFAHNVIVD
jgi:tetratricopeptide (TPR) repeat protein